MADINPEESEQDRSKAAAAANEHSGYSVEGDTPPAERRRLIAHPPDVLITTPESLFLMLTSAARETLTSVRTVIVDEVHAVAANDPDRQRHYPSMTTLKDKR